MSLTLLVATAAARNCHRHRTAPLQLSQGRRQGGVDQRLLLLPLDGVVLRQRLLAAGGEVLLRPLEEALEEALGGVRVRVLGQLGHHPQQGGGEPMQRQVRGVQEAAAGEQAVAQRETPVGAAPIHSKRRAGTCKTRTGSIIS